MINSYIRTVSVEPPAPVVANKAVQTFLDKFLTAKEQQEQYVSSHGRIYRFSGKNYSTGSVWGVVR